MPRKRQQPWERVRVPDSWAWANVRGDIVIADQHEWHVKGQTLTAVVTIRDWIDENDPAYFADQAAYRDVLRLMERWERKGKAELALRARRHISLWGSEIFGKTPRIPKQFRKIVSAPISECRFFDVGGNELTKAAYFWVERADGSRVEFRTPSEAVDFVVEHGLGSTVGIWHYRQPDEPVEMLLPTFRAQFGVREPAGRLTVEVPVTAEEGG